MREEYAADGPDVDPQPRAARRHSTRGSTRGEQSLVLLNRRGFATAVFCRQCAGTLDCPNCSVSLVVHGEGSAGARGATTATTPRACRPSARCAPARISSRPASAPSGSKPKSRTPVPARASRGSIATPSAGKARSTALLARFRDGEIDVLVGTQMIAKGHDFPRVTLVGVVSADVGLGLADFRASERTFQLLTQVAGRAGRGEQPGEAIVQTLYPDHYSIQLACRQDYPAFYEREMQFRRAMRYPPLISLVNAVVRARTFAGAMDDAADIVRVGCGCGGRGLRVLGPAPAPLGRLRGEYRAQLLIKGTNRGKIREALQAALAARPELQRRVVVDVDPLSVL